jgi:hypothetical protein
MWARADDSDVLGMTGVDKNNRYMLFTATKTKLSASGVTGYVRMSGVSLRINS